MPYYCTVPRCTSMAGKAKDVSFHQFPKDKHLAELWNEILKRGKPYTKYSKVCSLHFKPDDYTINSVGRKGQWRSLRKDAIPSQNLPSVSPGPHAYQSRGGGQAVATPSLMDPQIQQQFAQAIYVQTMLAMQAATFRERSASADRGVEEPAQSDSESDSSPPATPLNLTNSDLQTFLNTYNKTNVSNNLNTSYKCPDCTRYFKDPDVFIIHKRTHKNSNDQMMTSNPILANLLKPKPEDESFQVKEETCNEEGKDLTWKDEKIERLSLENDRSLMIC